MAFKSSTTAFLTKCVLFYIILSHCICAILGGAIFKLKFVSFKNSNERDWNGNCCDWACVGRCDHRFTICLDKSNGNSDFSSCQHGRYQTGEFKEQNTITFNHDMSGVANPIQKTLSSWPGSLKLKVEVKDDDSGHSSHDLVDRLFTTITVNAARSLAQASWTDKKVSGTRTKTQKTELNIKYQAYCEQDYFGSTCATYCKAVNEDGKGHYTCDPATGAKVCYPGYEDPANNCLRVADDCIGHYCQHGGTCEDRVGAYKCICKPGYIGDFCEINLKECFSNPCLNGATCTDGENMYTCTCASGYVGVNCEHHICGDNPCQNGGSCFVKDDNTIGCECTAHYAGERCSVYRCQILPCMNGGTCENGTCICIPGYLGNQCDVDYCDLTECHNGGTCHRETQQCICPEGYAGRYCELDVNECISNPCYNDGTCRDKDGFYECDCLPMFTGEHCETEMVPIDDDTDTTPNPDDRDPDVTEKPGENDVLYPPKDDTGPPKDPENDKIREDEDRDSDVVTDANPDVGVHPWVFAIIVVAVVLLLAIIIVTVLVLRYKRKKRLDEINMTMTPPTSPDSIGNFDNPLYSENIQTPPIIPVHMEGGAIGGIHHTVNPPPYSEDDPREKKDPALFEENPYAKISEVPRQQLAVDNCYDNFGATTDGIAGDNPTYDNPKALEAAASQDIAQNPYSNINASQDRYMDMGAGAHTEGIYDVPKPVAAEDAGDLPQKTPVPYVVGQDNPAADVEDKPPVENMYSNC